MTEMKLLLEHIDEELNDACTYARLALEYRDTELEMASLFYKLSGEEMTHADALHKRVIAVIDRYRQPGGDQPEGMKAIYEFVRKREIKKAEEIANLQNMFRN